MNNLQRTLENVANARRRELLPYVFNQTDGRVQRGPFLGMTIVPKTSWGDGDSAAKLLGVYEDELHPAVEDAIEHDPDLILNIGCAEGYYGVGLAVRLPESHVIAVDINPQAEAAVIENMAANQIKNLKCLIGYVDHAWLEEQCKNRQRPLLVVDCEGAELDLLDPEKITSLHKALILVECHDCMIPGITDTLIQRFSNSHVIVGIKQRYKDPYQFEFLEELSDCDKWCLVHEGRPSTMTWLYMVPKK